MSVQADQGPQNRNQRSLSSVAVTLLLSLWFVIVCNSPFWGAALQAEGGLTTSNVAFMVSLFLLVTLLINLLLTLMAWPAVARPLLGLVLIISSLVTYFMSAYGVVIDRTMIRNVIESDPGEVLELINPGLIVYFVLLGILPLLLLSRVRIEFAKWSTELSRKVLISFLTLAGVAAIAFGFNEHYASLLRNHRELRQLLTPLNYVAAVEGYVKEQAHTGGSLQIAGRDAKRSSDWPSSGRKALLVIVLGETARSASFSLAGYSRQTNPELSRKNVVFFNDVVACGTSTSVSVPCMFSGLGRRNFKETVAARREGLLDIVTRAGFSVLWRDNNSGCKGACDRIETEEMPKKNVSGLCRDGECWDEVLLDGLQERLDRQEGDLVIVLHQKGSHGPAYFKRYPDAFQAFQPACQDADLAQCSSDQIVNAYDNSILYTDHVLARTIELLERNSARFDSSLIYVSDHGESLGEKGLYLHGLPWVLAPDEQKKVPMIVWVSSAFQSRFGLRQKCLQANRSKAYSHDNFFHSVLGLLSIQTEVYRPELDLFGPCTR